MENEVVVAVEIPIVEEDKPLSPAEQEHAAAVARGDVLEQPKEDILDPAILAEIVAEKDDTVVVEAKKDDGVIPRARFNEVNEENKILKAQLEALKAPVTTQTDTETVTVDPVVVDQREQIRDLRKQQKDLELEGDLDAAGLISDKIDDLILQVATTAAESRLSQRVTQNSIQASLESVAAQAYTQYPFLDIHSSDVDVDAVVAVRARTSELISEGKTAVEALQAAVAEKGPKFALLNGIKTDISATDKADQVRAERNKAALEKAADASVAQPAALPSRTEKDSFAVDVKQLTPAQIKAMPEDQKARLRGDIV